MTGRMNPRVKEPTKGETPVKSALDAVPIAPFTTFLKHQRKALVEAGKALETVFPEAFREHGEAAIKESVEGYRTLVNTTIDEIIETFEKVKIGVEKEQKEVEPKEKEPVK